MTPYKIYLKNLLEGTGFAYDVADEDNMGFDDSDLRSDEDSDTGVYEITEEDETDDTVGLPTSSRRRRRTLADDDATELDTDSDGVSTSKLSENSRRSGRESLSSQLVELALGVFNAYQERGIGSYDSLEQASYRLLELVESGSPSPEALVGTMEDIGIGMNREGIDLEGAEVGTFTPEMLIQMYFYSMPLGKYRDDIAIPDEVMVKYTARKIDEHIKGIRGNEKPVILPNVTTYNRLSKSFSAKDKTVAKKRDVTPGFKGTVNTDTVNANVTHVDHVPTGRAFYFTPHAIYDRIKSALGKESTLAGKYGLDDLTAEYLFLGQSDFKKKYKTAPVDPLDLSMKSAGVSLSSPCYGSIGPEGEIRFGKNFRDILLIKELLPCKKGRGGIITDSKGTPIPGMGEHLAAALEGAKPGEAGFRTKDDELIKAIKGEYMYHTKSTGTVPMFDYFTTNTLLVSGSTSSQSSASAGEDDGKTDDHSQIALKQDEFMRNRSDEVDSGNAMLRTIDANMWAKLGSDASKKAIAAMGLEPPEAKMDDEVNMERITAILVAISKIFENAGAKSRITTYDGVHPSVELDDSETGTNESITTAWSNALRPAGGVKGVLKGVFQKADLFGMTNAMLEWANSFVGTFVPNLHDTVTKLGMASMLDECVRALTPSINIEDVIGDIIENGTEVSQDTMKYVLNYTVLTGRKIMCPFLENPRDMMNLLGYIDMKLEDEDPSADGGRSYAGQYTALLSRMMKWNVSMKSLNIVPPDDTDEPETLLDHKPADVFNWVLRKVSDINNTKDAVLIMLGMVEYARDMIGENDDIRRQDYLLGEESPVHNIWTAYDRYGKDSLLRLIGEACGDSGKAIGTLWSTLNSRTPVDNENELDAIENAVRTLATVSGITFNVDTSDTTH